MQHEITRPIPLLDSKGNLTEPGWARSLLPVYDREKVKGGILRLKEWDYYYVGNDRFGVIAWLIASKLKTECAASMGQRGKLHLIRCKLGEHRFAADVNFVIDKQHRLSLRLHAVEVAHQPSHRFGRRAHFKRADRLKQHVLGVHERISYGTVGALAEIAAFGVLEMGSSGKQRHMNVGQR